MIRRLLIVSYLVLILAQAWASDQASYKVEPTGADPEKDVAEGIRKVLQPKGVRLLDDKSTMIAELWLRDAIPLKSGNPSYNALGEGTLVGVLRFASKGSDFRGQAIKPGSYTLRYGQIPQDGNHLGVSPQPDFLLLTPAVVDKDLDAQPKLEALVKMSRQASGTNHPAVLMLVLPTSSSGNSGVQRTDQGHWAVVCKTQARAGEKTSDFPVALVLVGKAEQ